MYIEPFWVGVAATVLVEVGLVILAAVVSSIQANRRKRHKNNDQGRG